MTLRSGWSPALLRPKPADSRHKTVPIVCEWCQWTEWASNPTCRECPTGLATCSIILCWLFTIKDLYQKCVFNKCSFKVCVSEGPLGRNVSSKWPSRVRYGDEGVAGRNRREYCFPDKGSDDLPSRQSNYFFTKRKQKKLSQWPDQANSESESLKGKIKMMLKHSLMQRQN